MKLFLLGLSLALASSIGEERVVLPDQFAIRFATSPEQGWEPSIILVTPMENGR